MRSLYGSIISIILVSVFFQTDLFPQTATNDSSKSTDRKIKGWENSVYIAAAAGTPQGLRFELGYNFGRYISLAATFGIADNWSRDPEEGTVGFVGKVNLFQIEPATLYFLVGYGTTLTLFGGADSYILMQAGSKIPLTDWFLLSPEAGLVHTSKYLWGGGFFSTSRPVYKSDFTFGANLSLEIDLRSVF